MANILDGICPEGFILDGFDEWPASTTRKEWFRITRELVASTIAPINRLLIEAMRAISRRRVTATVSGSPARISSSQGPSNRSRSARLCRHVNSTSVVAVLGMGI